MTSAQAVEMSDTTTDNSPSQDCTHPDDQTTLLQYWEGLNWEFGEDEKEKRLFLKEAKKPHGIESEHIAKFKAVCMQPCAMMLEYLFFRLRSLRQLRNC